MKIVWEVNPKPAVKHRIEVIGRDLDGKVLARVIFDNKSGTNRIYVNKERTLKEKLFLLV